MLFFDADITFSAEDGLHKVGVKAAWEKAAKAANAARAARAASSVAQAGPRASLRARVRKAGDR